MSIMPNRPPFKGPFGSNTFGSSRTGANPQGLSTQQLLQMLQALGPIIQLSQMAGAKGNANQKGAGRVNALGGPADAGYRQFRNPYDLTVPPNTPITGVGPASFGGLPWARNPLATTLAATGAGIANRREAKRVVKEREKREKEREKLQKVIDSMLKPLQDAVDKANGGGNRSSLGPTPALGPNALTAILLGAGIPTK